MLIFVFLTALQMFLRYDINVLQFQQNSKQHETFGQVVQISKEYVLLLMFFQNLPTGSKFNYVTFLMLVFCHAQ